MSATPAARPVVASLLDVAPAVVPGAGPVLAFLAPWLVGAEGLLSLSPSLDSEVGFVLSGGAEDLLAVSAALRAEFGAAVLVGPVVDVLG